MPEPTLTVFENMLDGRMSEADMSAYLLALNQRGFGEEEILAAAKALRNRMTVFEGAEDAVDCCGTGGDGLHTLNISTAVSFVLAGAGVKVAKHGNRAVSSKSGSGDVLAALGVNTEAPQGIMQKAYKETNLCYLSAPLYHPAMRHVALVRKNLGQRTIFNLLGPLASPAKARRQVVGVYDKKYLALFPSILGKLGSLKVWAVHGEDGLDEITTTTATEVQVYPSDHFKITPQELGLAPASLADLKGGDAAENAEKLKALLTGTKTPYRDIVLLNAAAGFVVAGKAAGLKDGLMLGADSIDQGHAKSVMEKFTAVTREAA